MLYNGIKKSIFTLICIALVTMAYADDAHYEVNTAVGKISVSAPILYAQTTPYVSLGELLRNLGGAIQVNEETCKANYNTVTANIKPDTVAVTAPGVSFSLLYPARLHEGNIYLAQTDIENFFSQAYNVQMIPTIGQNTDSTTEARKALLDEDMGSLLEVLPLPKPDAEVLPEEEPPPAQAQPVTEAEAVAQNALENEETPDTEEEAPIVLPDIQGTLVLDAGHGGQDTGMTAGKDIAEKNIDLAILLKLRTILKEKTALTIHVTRDADKEMSPGIRAKTANALGGDLLISIHTGYSNIPRRTGVVLFSDQLPTPPDAKADREIREAFMRRRSYGEQASKIAYAMAQTLAEDNSLGEVNVRKAPLLLQRVAEMPCILIELAYLNNPDTAASVTEEEYQLHAAETLALAIAAALPEDNN